MEQARAEIKAAASEAVKVIADAAASATAVISTAAATAAKMLIVDNNVRAIDHDLLIKLDTKVDRIKEDIRGIKDDHEERLRAVETKTTRIMTFGTAALIILGIIEFLINQYAHK